MEYTESFIQSIIQNMINGFACHRIITNEEGKPIDYLYIDVNNAFENLTGLKRKNVIGKRVKEIISYIELDDFNWIDFYGEMVLSGVPGSANYYSNALGKTYKVNAYSPEKGYFISVFTDITNSVQREDELVRKNNELNQLYEELFSSQKKLIEQYDEMKEFEQIIARMAYYDQLTNLPNRVMFTDMLKESIERSNRNGSKVVIAYLDFDNFKRVNDSLGHANGDKLLTEFSRRIEISMRERNTIARLSGDEFSLMIENIEKVDEAVPVIDRIRHLFDEPFNIDNCLINMTTSIGVSVFPDDGGSVEALLKNADIAMYKAKELGKNRYQLFNACMEQDLVRKLKIEGLLRKAIKNDEFLLYYQPQYEAKNRRIRGFEALIRWNNSEMGFLNPLDFIPIAEETGLILAIGEWVLNKACTMCKKMNDIDGYFGIMAVNISPIQLRQKDFYDIVLQAISTSGISPTSLELEVTESIFIDNFDGVIKVLSDLKKVGVRIALDDFGIGYSSLNYLKKLPINLLKIDKSFIREIDVLNPKNELTDSIISLVHRLDIETLAEGIENEVQLDYLVNAECNNLQGFYFSRPVPENEVNDVIKRTIL